MSDFWQWITYPPNTLTAIAGVGVFILLVMTIWDEVNS